MKKTFFFLLISLIFSSCFMSKNIRLAKKGNVKQSNFNKEFDFEYYNDLIIVEVIIDGKKLHFIFDTGAFLSVIDEKVLGGLQTEVMSKSKARSSSGKAEKKPIISIDEMEIGGVKFQNTSAIVVDFSGIQGAFGCHQVDGLIGNNLMRKANWQIDYQKKIINVTDQISNLEVSEKAYSFNLGRRKWGNTALPVKINGLTRNFTFDTGFSGFLRSNLKYRNKLINNGLDSSSVSVQGELGFDLYGRYKAVSHRVMVPTIGIDKIKLDNKIVQFKGSGSSLLGNGFYENYLLTLDWDEHQLYLDAVKQVDADSLNVFQLQIVPNYKTNQLQVSGTWVEHPLEKPIASGTQILKVNKHNLSNLSKDELCQFWDETWIHLKKRETIEIETKQGKVTLTKKLLLVK